MLTTSTAPRATLGGLELHLLDAGRFRLDGGAMFRVVPKVLWDRVTPADEKNRIQLAMRPLLVRSEDGRWVLVESGIGARRRDRKFCDNFAVEPGPEDLGLSAAGVKPEEIAKVVVTHMHFDHVGGVVTSAMALAFPNAKLVVQKGELEDAYAGCDLCKASYVEDDWRVWKDARRLEVVDGDAEIAKGVSVVRTGGHTRAHQVVTLSSGGKKGAFWGDLIPTSAHLKPHFVMAYDLYPMDVWTAKKELVARMVDERWLSVFYHDPRTPFGTVVRDGKDYRVEALS